VNLNPAVELPQKGTSSTNQREAVTDSFREGDTCWVNRFFAEQCDFYSIPLRLLCLFVADPNAFLG
jgi:hypothetical protein